MRKSKFGIKHFIMILLNQVQLIKTDCDPEYRERTSITKPTSAKWDLDYCTEYIVLKCPNGSTYDCCNICTPPARVSHCTCCLDYTCNSRCDKYAINCDTCPEKTFLNGGYCRTCSQTMPNCVDCNSATNCLKCATTTEHFLIKNRGGKKDECKSCLSMMPNCKTCDSQTNCLQCKSGYLRIKKSGKDECKKCGDIVKYCTICKPIGNPPTDYYCARCDSSASLTKKLEGKQTCLYNCPSGYGLKKELPNDSRGCQPCGDKFCDVCDYSPSISCQGCKAEYYFHNFKGSPYNSFKCLRACPKTPVKSLPSNYNLKFGYNSIFLGPEQDVCGRCMDIGENENCPYCFNITRDCYQCDKNYWLHDLNKTVDEILPHSLYSKFSCIKQCHKFTPESKNIEGEEGVIFAFDSALTGKTNSECAPCTGLEENKHCPYCFNITRKCYKCESGYYLHHYSGEKFSKFRCMRKCHSEVEHQPYINKKTQLVYGKYIGTIGEMGDECGSCKEIDSNCVYCKNFTRYCFECEKTYWLNGTFCQKECPPEYFGYVRKINNCKSCLDQNCLRCDNNTLICNTCKEDYWLNETFCQLQCDETEEYFYFPNNCGKCGQDCYRCTNHTKVCERCFKKFIKITEEDSDCIPPRRLIQVESATFDSYKSIAKILFDESMRDKNITWNTDLIITMKDENQKKFENFTLKKIELDDNLRQLLVHLEIKKELYLGSMLIYDEEITQFIGRETHLHKYNEHEIRVGKVVVSNRIDLTQQIAKTSKTVTSGLTITTVIFALPAAVVLIKMIQFFDFFLLINIELPFIVVKFLNLFRVKIINLKFLNLDLQIDEAKLRCVPPQRFEENDFSCFLLNNAAIPLIQVTFVILVKILITLIVRYRISKGKKKQKKEKKINPNESSEKHLNFDENEEEEDEKERMERENQDQEKKEEKTEKKDKAKSKSLGSKIFDYIEKSSGNSLFYSIISASQFDVFLAVFVNIQALHIYPDNKESTPTLLILGYILSIIAFILYLIFLIILIKVTLKTIKVRKQGDEITRTHFKTRHPLRHWLFLEEELREDLPNLLKIYPSLILVKELLISFFLVFFYFIPLLQIIPIIILQIIHIVVLLVWKVYKGKMALIVETMINGCYMIIAICLFILQMKYTFSREIMTEEDFITVKHFFGFPIIICLILCIVVNCLNGTIEILALFYDFCCKKKGSKKVSGVVKNIQSGLALRLRRAMMERDRVRREKNQRMRERIREEIEEERRKKKKKKQDERKRNIAEVKKPVKERINDKNNILGNFKKRKRKKKGNSFRRNVD